MNDNLNFIDKFLANRWATHSLFWISLVTFAILQQYLSVFNDRLFKDIFFNYLGLVPSQMLCAYILSYELIPKFLYTKKYVKFFFSFLITMYLGAMLARLLTVFVAEPIYQQNLIQETFIEILTDPLYLVLIYLPAVYGFPVLMAAIKILKDRYKEREKFENLKQEKTKAELNFLKSQIHPHFLLNTLNNLYALTLKKSDKAPETVIKLSDMLVYTLYKCDEKYVPLDSEIELLKNYISLERLRYGDNLNLQFNEDVADKNVKIAPLILLSIVENAFKHGVSGEIEDAEIKIDLEQIENEFKLEVFNTKSEFEQEDETDYTKGIGIENVKKQLDLVYPNRYVFEIVEKQKTYKVLLKLELEKNEN